MPQFMKHLHYRIIDVSTVKELCRLMSGHLWTGGWGGLLLQAGALQNSQPGVPVVGEMEGWNWEEQRLGRGVQRGREPLQENIWHFR